jgi:hypothetical protein
MSIRSSYPSISPSLNLDFAKSKSFDPRITFTRTQTGNIASYVGSDGLIKYAGPDEPRFDHKLTFRTNLLIYSAAIDGYWYENQNLAISNATGVEDALGGLNVVKLTEDTADSTHSVYRNLYINQGQTATFSVFLKPINRHNGFIYVDAGGGHHIGRVHFDLYKGVITSTSAGLVDGTLEGYGIEPYPNDWYRVWITGNISSQTYLYFHVNSSNIENGNSFIGNGLDAFYMSAPQVEYSSTPTDYIATGPSAVTRTATESLGLLIEESRTNLVTYSQDFTQSIWQSASNRATCDNTTGIDDPSGGTTASRWSSGTSAGQELIYRQTGTSAGTLTGETCTKSIWIRRVSNDGSVSFFLGDNVGNVVNSQLDSVPVGTWVRCSITRTIVGNNGDTRNYIAVYPGTNGQPTTIDIWGDQFEIGSFPTSYIPTSGSSVTRPVDSCGIAASQMSGWFNSDNFSMTIEAESSGSTPGVGRAIWGISDGGSFNNSMYLTLPENNNTVTLSMVTGGTGQGTLAFDSVFDKNTVYNLGFGVANADRVTVNGGAVTNSISSGTLASEYNQFNIGSGWSLGAARQGRATISKLTYYPKRITNSQLQILTK